MRFLASYKGIAIVALIVLVLLGVDQSGVFGDTRIGITLKSNLSLNVGLVAHYTFDGDFEQGSFEFGAAGATTSDPTTGDDEPAGSYLDDSGYLYITGDCDGCGVDGFTALYTQKIDPLSGDVVWATSTDVSGGVDRGDDIVVDDNGDVYIVGANLGGNIQYVAKLNGETSDFIWEQTFNETGAESLTSVDLDNAGYVYATGRCSGCGSNGGDAYVTRKFDPTDGTQLWSTTTDPTSGTDRASGIAADPDGDVIVTGRCAGCGHLGNNAHYTIKIDGDDGSMLWATTTEYSSGVTTEESHEVVIDSDGNAYVSGFCAGCSSTSNILYKVDGDTGGMIWVLIDGATSNNYVTDLTLDPANEFVYFTGNTSDDIYTYKADATTGIQSWSTTTDVSGNFDQGRSISVGSDGYGYVTAIVDDESCGGGGSDRCWYTFKFDVTDGSMASTTSSDAIAGVDATRVQGNIGQAVEFDGIDDYILKNNESNLDITGDITVAAWMKRGSVSTNDYILSKTQADGTTDDYFFYFSSDGSLRFGGDAISQAISTYADFPADEWMHVVAVRSGSSVAFFKDGEFVDAGNTNSSSMTTGGDLYIGQTPSVGRFFDGILDDVRIYNSALATSSISRLYQLGATTKINKTLDSNDDLKNGLVMHHTFDGIHYDSSSTTAEFTDASGNARNADWDTVSEVGPGAIGQGVYIGADANHSVDVEEFAESEGLSQMTASIWIKPETFDWSGESFQYLFSKTRSGFQQWGIAMTGGGNPNHINFTIGTTTGTAEIQSEESELLGEPRWYHLTAVYNDPAMLLYLDGELLATSSGYTPAGGAIRADYDHPICIGASYSGSDCNSNASLPLGWFDDARIYNRALSQPEISRLYQLGATTKVNTTIDTNPDLDTGLVVHYTFDGRKGIDMSSTTAEVLDNSGNGWTGDYTDTNRCEAVPGVLGQGITCPESGSFEEGIDIGSTTELHLTTYSASIWAKLGPINSLEPFIGFDGSNNPHINFNVMGQETPLIWLGANNFKYFSGTDPVNIYDDKWHHLVFVVKGQGQFDVDQSELWVDGQQQDADGFTNTSGLPDPPDGEVQILKRGGSGVDGSFDDFRLYDYALSTSTIQRLYQLGQ